MEESLTALLPVVKQPTSPHSGHANFGPGNGLDYNAASLRYLAAGRRDLSAKPVASAYLLKERERLCSFRKPRLPPPAVGFQPLQREYPQPPPPSKMTTKTITNNVVVSI
jgi:hypothetical protein